MHWQTHDSIRIQSWRYSCHTLWTDKQPTQCEYKVGGTVATHCALANNRLNTNTTSAVQLPHTVDRQTTDSTRIKRRQYNCHTLWTDKQQTQYEYNVGGTVAIHCGQTNNRLNTNTTSAVQLPYTVDRQTTDSIRIQRRRYSCHTLWTDKQQTQYEYNVGGTVAIHCGQTNNRLNTNTTSAAQLSYTVHWQTTDSMRIQRRRSSCHTLCTGKQPTQHECNVGGSVAIHCGQTNNRLNTNTTSAVQLPYTVDRQTTDSIRIQRRRYSCHTLWTDKQRTQYEYNVGGTVAIHCGQTNNRLNTNTTSAVQLPYTVDRQTTDSIRIQRRRYSCHTLWTDKQPTQYEYNVGGTVAIHCGQTNNRLNTNTTSAVQLPYNADRQTTDSIRIQRRRYSCHTLWTDKQPTQYEYNVGGTVAIHCGQTNNRLNTNTTSAVQLPYTVDRQTTDLIRIQRRRYSCHTLWTDKQPT